SCIAAILSWQVSYYMSWGGRRNNLQILYLTKIAELFLQYIKIDVFLSSLSGHILNHNFPSI
ncbi:MAG: hypothetical protein QGF57_07690, partial [Candidatus Marinimicrobia bacterium]|nr:hypothetical protein [Candidatus Neomarinimicrobiota bacterium]